MNIKPTIWSPALLMEMLLEGGEGRVGRVGSLTWGGGSAKQNTWGKIFFTVKYKIKILVVQCNLKVNV